MWTRWTTISSSWRGDWYQKDVPARRPVALERDDYDLKRFRAPLPDRLVANRNKELWMALVSVLGLWVFSGLTRAVDR